MATRTFGIGEIVGARTVTGLIGTAKISAVNADGSYRIRRLNGISWGDDERVSANELTTNRPMPADRDLYESQVPTEDRESTTFTQDFMIAEAYGISAIRDTFNRAFAEWKNCYKYLTELTMTLNHRIHHWYYKTGENDERTILYNELWQKTYDWGCANLNGEELSFFYNVLD